MRLRGRNHGTLLALALSAVLTGIVVPSTAAADPDQSDVVLILDNSASILRDTATRGRFATALDQIAARVDATSADLVAGDTTVSLVQFASKARDVPGCAELPLLNSPENVGKFANCLRSVANDYRKGPTKALTRAIGSDTNYVAAMERAARHLPADAERPVAILFSDGKHDVKGVPASEVTATRDRLFGSRAPFAFLPVGMGLDPGERGALEAGLARLRTIREMPPCVSGATFDWPQVVFDSPDQAGAAVAVALQDATCTFTVAPTPVPTPPPAPTAVRGLRAVAHDGRVDLSWAAPVATAAQVVDYKVRCRSGAGDWIESTEGVSPDPTASVAGLPPGSEYECEVVAVGTGAESAPATATTTEMVPPAAPGKPSVTAKDRSVEISITPTEPATVGAIVEKYRYECSGDGGKVWVGTDAPSPSQTTATLGSLTNGVPYSCRVIASNLSGVSEASALSDLVTPCGGPLECNGLLAPVIGLLGIVLFIGLIMAIVAYLRGRQRGHVVAVVDVVHTANLGAGSRLGIRFERDPVTKRVTGLISDRGRGTDVQIRQLGGGRFQVKDRSGRRVMNSGDAIIVVDSTGGRHELVLHAFATNAASPVSGRA